MFNKFVTLLAVAVLMCSVAFAGGHVGPKAPPPARITGEESIVRAPVTSPLPPAPYSLGPGDSIGYTFYDYGTNGSASRTLINYGDGTISFARMSAVDSGSFGWGTRGSYNKCFTGGAWESIWERIEAVRVGWTNVDQIADAGGVEVVMTHAGTECNVDAARCADTWTSSLTGATGQFWPRVAVGSGFTIHLISADNPPSSVWYQYSPDAGASWVVDQVIWTLPGWIADADAYDITAQGTNVAAVIAGAGSDIILAESADGGATWTETKIYDIDENLGTPDEEVPDGSVSALYDSDGDLHVAWGNYLSLGDGLFYFSVDAGIRHWTSVTGVQEVAWPDPDTTIVVPLGRDGQLATQPDLAADASGNVYMVFSRFINEIDVNGNYYEHAFASATRDGGATWEGPIDVTPGTGFDASFPSVADLADSYLHIAYQSDAYAGNFLQVTPGHPDIAVAHMYLMVDVTTITGVKEVPGELPTAYSLEQNYPNPFNPSTKIHYSIPAASFVTLKVFDVLGREVATLVNEQQTSGSYEAEFNAASLADGAYFYKLQAGNFTETKKMMLLK